MDIIGTKVRFTIDEPWDSEIDITGRINQLLIIEKQQYYVIEEELSHDKYLATPRYEEHFLEDILLGKTIIVSVSIPKERDFSSDKSISIKEISYIGFGGIKILVS